jgi:hypothetical protein
LLVLAFCTQYARRVSWRQKAASPAFEADTPAPSPTFNLLVVVVSKQASNQLFKPASRFEYSRWLSNLIY